MKSIDACIIGAQKSGTTSLMNYLSLHPSICSHWQPEMPYFFLDDVYSRGYDQAYERYFSSCKHPESSRLAKNVDIIYSQTALERLRLHNPVCKLIIVVRNPVDRAYSAFWFALQRGRETVKYFDEAVWLDPGRHQDIFSQGTCSYLDRGLYAKHLEQVYQRFPHENVRVYLFENLIQNTATICKDIFLFLGIAPIEIDIEHRHNVASILKYPLVAEIIGQRNKYKWMRQILRQTIPDATRDRMRAWIDNKNRTPFSYPPIDPNTRQKLLTFFEPYNRQLEQMLDIDLSSWNT